MGSKPVILEQGWAWDLLSSTSKLQADTFSQVWR